MKKEISPEHKLPCDFVVGHIRYRKGVQLETVRKAAERWLKQAASFETLSPYDLKHMIGKTTNQNLPD